MNMRAVFGHSFSLLWFSPFSTPDHGKAETYQYVVWDLCTGEFWPLSQKKRKRGKKKLMWKRSPFPFLPSISPSPASPWTLTWPALRSSVLADCHCHCRPCRALTPPLTMDGSPTASFFCCCCCCCVLVDRACVYCCVALSEWSCREKGKRKIYLWIVSANTVMNLFFFSEPLLFCLWFHTGCLLITAMF